MTAPRHNVEALQKKVDVSPTWTPKTVLDNGAAHSIVALMRQEFAPISWLVDGLIPQGTVLLAGKPKSGKSWFALNLMVASRLNIHFLRHAVTPCHGLYLALEDTPKRMQSRMRVLMLDYATRIDELEGFEYRTDWPKGDIGAANLDEYLTAHSKCRIVAVDVLARIRTTSDRRNAYEQDYEAIACWKEVADRRGIVLLIVHHTRKAEADDVFDEVSGTLAINGVVDQVMVLKRLPDQPRQATLHMRGRDLIDDQALGLELHAGWWKYIDTAANITATDERRTVMEVLREAEAPLTVTELLKATRRRSRPSLLKLLSAMVSSGQVHRADKGKYAFGPKGDV